MNEPTIASLQEQLKVTTSQLQAAHQSLLETMNQNLENRANVFLWTNKHNDLLGQLAEKQKVINELQKQVVDLKAAAIAPVDSAPSV